MYGIIGGFGLCTRGRVGGERAWQRGRESAPRKTGPREPAQAGAGSRFRFVISIGDDMLPVLGPVLSLQFPVGFSLLGTEAP